MSSIQRVDCLPPSVVDYLVALLGEDRRLTCLRVEREHATLIYGDPGRFGLRADGSGLLSLHDLLLGQDPLHNGLLLEELQVGSGAPCDVHQVVSGGLRYLLLLDRSDWHARAQRLQQRSNEASLAQARLEGQSRRLDDENQLLARRLRELSETQRLQEAFVRRFAHDFGTPISTVLGHVEQLADTLADDAAAERSLHSIRRGVEYLHQLVESVLDQARLENHQFELHPAPTNLQRLSGDVADLFQPVARERGLAWSVELDPAPPGLVEIDLLRLRQVLYNLLSNAFKYTLSGHVRLQLQWSQGRLRVVVADTGRGLSAEQQQQLYVGYQRFASGVRGTGLGLGIVQQILEHMGSRLEIDSRPGAGSRFAFTVAAPAVEQPPAASQEASGMPARALVIDDDADLGDLLGAHLKRRGWQVDVRLDDLGEGGPAPAVAIIDLNLGSSLAGLAVMRAARKRWPQTALIGISADRSQHVRELCREAGAVAFIGKPIGEQALAQALQQCGLGPAEQGKPDVDSG